MAPLLKDQIDAEVVGSLASAFRRRHSSFDVDSFVAAVNATLDELELKDRINLIADMLATYLPPTYTDALAIVTGVADDGVGEWASWSLCSFVERHGVGDPEPSLAAMPILTKAWSCEFAIRPFLAEHLELSLEHLRRWTADDDERVRRLPSEGTRPLLPWGPRVPALLDDPQIGIELITALRHDPSETVRRSVANHLNDVAKAHPDLVVAVLGDWMAESEPVDDRMVRHSLRTLIKNGHRPALELLGFTTNPEVGIESFSCTPSTVHLGNHIELTATLSSTAESEQLLVVDFVIHHVNASGGTSPKVFKWKTVTLESGGTERLTKRRLIQTASTRSYHPGEHRIDLQVGGQVLATTAFSLAG
ncbi:MAG: DNA alkylation repair protein [Acidimicrobiales bacterium]